MSASRGAARLLPPLRRRLRAAAGVLPRVRRPAADEPRRRRRARVAWQRRLAWYPGDWIWPVGSSSSLAVARRRPSCSRTGERERRRPRDRAPDVPVGPGATQGTVPVASTATIPTPPRRPSRPARSRPRPARRRRRRRRRRRTRTRSRPGPREERLHRRPRVAPRHGRQGRRRARARQAKQKGLKDVGVLISSQYSSLHPGYYVVFAGIYGTRRGRAASRPPTAGVFRTRTRRRHPLAVSASRPGASANAGTANACSLQRQRLRRLCDRPRTCRIDPGGGAEAC